MLINVKGEEQHNDKDDDNNCVIDTVMKGWTISIPAISLDTLKEKTTPLTPMLWGKNIWP